MKRIAIVTIVIIALLLPTVIIAGNYITESGHSLYSALNSDNPTTKSLAAGYISGIFDGVMMQVAMNRTQGLKNCHINIPSEGVLVWQQLAIFKQWVIENQHKASGSARVCVYLSLGDAYGTLCR